MRPLIQIVTHEVGGIRFMALNLYDERGQHADQIVKPAEDFEIIDAVTDLLRIHGNDTVDVETDEEGVFKAFLSVPGVNVSFVLTSEMRPLYGLFAPHSYVWLALCELYDIADKANESEIEVPASKEVTLWERLKQLISGLIKRWRQ